eukprot:CAMPEP_0202898854 /NCGR_PEP_ID=MMETSP1392-20130828/7259_1 /ASSEMBLY_ACC=CAM_ASM_000868 /TAXON_ID=225041 /ORGANISM="Chlamydomonas chlamydogama, Strain SAG 11-48b" /LENGTH=1673 /DNA_ID=CAMNT_0049584895 /DNA_START=265 /DNA_END=5289 /DNA_ORIENTATION=+
MASYLQKAFLAALCLCLLGHRTNADAANITLQAGRAIRTIDGTTITYNSTYETAITTLYSQESWSKNNGETFFGGEPEYRVQGKGGELAESMRYLMKFDLLHKYLPAAAQITSAELQLTFSHWDSQPVTVEACFLSKSWMYQRGSVPRYEGTGWKFRTWDTATRKSIAWAEQGGWGDCLPGITLKWAGLLPDNGYQVTRISLDPYRVQQWLKSSGASNYGLLFRTSAGSSVNILSSNSVKYPGYRPALTLTYSTNPADAPKPVTGNRIILAKGREVWVDASAGDDGKGSGLATYPYKTLTKAAREAYPGDVIMLRTGVYAGDITITRPFIGLQSAPGHWAVISSPINIPAVSTALGLRYTAKGGFIRNLEITGGFDYGLFFGTDWDHYGDRAEQHAKATGASDWRVENVRIHDTGSSALKVGIRAHNVSIVNCELYNAGKRVRVSGHGVVAVNANSLRVQDTYIHDVGGAGVHLTGGCTDAIIDRTYIATAGFGVNLGFGEDVEYMSPQTNPQLWDCISCTLRNSIIAGTYMAGVGLKAAYKSEVSHNTIWAAEEGGQAAILIDGYERSDGSPDYTPCADLTITNNIATKSATALGTNILQIRSHNGQSGLRPGSALLLDGNVYYDASGRAAAFNDDLTDFTGNLAAWRNLCQATHPGCDASSREGDPRLSTQFVPGSCSPAYHSGRPGPPSRDFFGTMRDGSSPDVGAVASSSGPLGLSPLGKAWPPVPSAFASIPAYTGPPQLPMYDMDWPWDHWATRTRQDLRVDPDSGSDNQGSRPPFRTFKTIKGALAVVEAGDRILLAAGKTHRGPISLRAPNITLTTDPAAGPAAAAAKILCRAADTGDSNPCIFISDAITSSAHLLIRNIEVVMEGAASKSACIQFFDGEGGGSSTPYWNFYVSSHGFDRAPGYEVNTLIEQVKLTDCGTHGIKLSPFVSGVTIRNVIASGRGRTGNGAGIVLVNSKDVLIQNCVFTNFPVYGIQVGGGSRNVVLDGNTVQGTGDAGIILGSIQTETYYMDAEYATAFDPEWHDALNVVVTNNAVQDTGGPGLALYSARDCSIRQNMFKNVASASKSFGAVLFSVSPKSIRLNREVGAPNRNINIQGNTFIQAAGSSAYMVAMRNIKATTPVPNDYVPPGASACPSGRRALHAAAAAYTAHGSVMDENMEIDPVMASQDADSWDSHRESEFDGIMDVDVHETGAGRALLQATRPWAIVGANLPGTAPRRPDGSCPVFPANSPWNTLATSLPVHRNSDLIVQAIGARNLHPDFGGGEARGGGFIYYGIPFITVDTSRGQAFNPILFEDYEDESDPGPYPYPLDAPIEGSFLGCDPNECDGDRHVLVVDNATCLLYETWQARRPTGSSRQWVASNGAVFNLTNNKLRPFGWTSGDAAGLPIMPGLIGFDEVINQGVIRHALRFTGPNSRRAYALPATHFAARNPGANSPWMGLRVRIKASYDCSRHARVARIVCTALQTYGAFFADNGGSWFFQGEATAKWDPYLREVADIKNIPYTAMEVLDTGCLCLDSSCTRDECTATSSPPKPPAPAPSPLPPPRPSPSPAARSPPGSVRRPPPQRRNPPFPPSAPAPPPPPPRPPGAQPGTLPEYSSVEAGRLLTDVMFINNVFYRADNQPATFLIESLSPVFQGLFASWSHRVGGGPTNQETKPNGVRRLE